LLPHEFPAWQTAYHYFRLWRLDGTWEHVNTVLREQLHVTIGRNAHPSAGIIDSQSVRTTGVDGVRGYDGAKRVNGRKRHILVDTGGLVLLAKGHTGDMQDSAAVPLLLEGADEQFPRVEHLWVDQGYTGSGKSCIEDHGLRDGIVISLQALAGLRSKAEIASTHGFFRKKHCRSHVRWGQHCCWQVPDRTRGCGSRLR